MLAVSGTDSRGGRVTEQLVDILFVDDHFTEIESVIKAIRASGVAVREVHAKELPEIRRTASVQPPDLIFYDADTNVPPIASVRNALGETARVSPMLALTHKSTDGDRTTALQAGFRDLVNSSDLDQLVLVVEREMEVLRLRRRAAKTEIMLNDAESRCDGLMDSARDAIAFVHEGAHVYINPAYLSLFGYASREEVEGLPIMNMVPKKGRDDFKKLFRRFSRGKAEPGQLEMTCLKADGDEFEALVELLPANVQGEPCAQVVFRPAHAEQDMESQMEELRRRDPVTGLYNRLHFKTVLDAGFAAAHSGKAGGSLLYILLNEYRSICERFSITSGDDLSRGISKLLLELCGTSDTVARFSEPTFVVLTSARGEEAEALAELIRARIAGHPSEAGSSIITTTCCIGICDLAAGNADSGEVVKLADAACESARQGGGDRVEVHRPNGGSDFLSMVERVEKAIAEDRLVLAFQPVATLSGDATPRYSVQVQVKNREGGLVGPGEEFGTPKGDGALAPLDRWVLGQCVERTEAKNGTAAPPTLLVPVTVDTLLDDDTPAWMEEHLNGKPGLVMVVEEDIATQYFRQTQQLAQRGRSQQCGLAIDRFGNDQNSGRLVDLLRPNYIRLHPELTEALGENANNRSKIDEFATAVRAVGGEAIAVGIGNAHQLANVWQTSLTLVEGDFLAASSEEMEFDFEQFGG